MILYRLLHQCQRTSKVTLALQVRCAPLHNLPLSTFPSEDRLTGQFLIGQILEDGFTCGNETGVDDSGVAVSSISLVGSTQAQSQVLH
jgi:hypothetical protein